ncbi:hypothetical protein V6M85_02470 [Sulfolobus tengchongensis]|uniref:Uncharacterized protein n=1 Tax=Sulfolobus tengchongensis TaxID=207809 RepID=A0AAX4L3K0_9CREN
MIDEKRNLSKLLHYLQRFGDHNQALLEQLTGIKNVNEIISQLKPLVIPSPRSDRLGLQLFHTIIKLPKGSKLQPLDFYYLMDGMILASLKDVITNNTLVLDVLYPIGRWDFIQLLEMLQEKGLIDEFKSHMEYKKEVYPVDYSTFNFESLTFESSILDKPREPFQLPDLADGFKADWVDVVVLGKKQANPFRSWDEVANSLGISRDDVVFHYFDHVIGKGLVDAFYVYLGKIDFRLTLIIDDVRDEIVRELSRIVTLLRVSYLHDDKIYAFIIGQNHMLLEITQFISKLSSNYNFSYKLYVHPLTPLRDFARTYSIPYEHFTKENKWSISLRELKDNLEKELARILQREVNEKNK